MLIQNLSRGIRYEPETDELFSWATRRGTELPGPGRVHPAQTARIEIEGSEDEIDLRLIGQDGDRIPGFSNKVLLIAPGDGCLG